MPLGIFSSSGKDGGPKPQPLTSSDKNSSKKEKANASSSTGIELKDASKGSTVKLCKKTYTIERKLAEGGFAIVYLVADKNNRFYALKRQLIRDDPRQVEACRTESQIVKNLNGHKNIIEYVDHQLSMNKARVYDYMLLTVFYPENVLQLMNSRLLVNKWLTRNEILNIFCDVCEAVARLHHSKTPVIHRDLKVENVLIDRSRGGDKPLYVLCDFGSATTKVLSKEHYPHTYMEEEIQRYTTLSYRAPEMVDLFSGVTIDTKSDIWALGIMLYKLSYFALPFGESALAIQSGLFTFPDIPKIDDDIKAIMNLLLTLSARHRPNIFQTSYLAFSAAEQKCPIYNIEKSARIELKEAVQILRLRDKLGSNYAHLFEKAINDFEAQKRRHTAPSTVSANSFDRENARQAEVPISNVNAGAKECQTAHLESSKLSLSHKPTEGVIVNTMKEKKFAEMHPRSATTSVNPRLRPKPNQGQKQMVNSNANAGDKIAKKSVTPPLDKNQPQLSEPKTSTLQFADDQGVESSNSDQPIQSGGGIMSPGLHTSAFKPYTLAKDKKSQSSFLSLAQKEPIAAMVFESSNPFIQPQSCADFNMDDTVFGQHFDALRRDQTSAQREELIDENPDLVAAEDTKKNAVKPSNWSKPRRPLPTRIHKDWVVIEREMGDNPFLNAPPLLAYQYFKQYD